MSRPVATCVAFLGGFLVMVLAGGILGSPFAKAEESAPPES